MSKQIKNKKPVIIIGAGIGGLATAIALRQAGFEVEVFERVSEMKGVGAGLSLWPNAVKVLYKLGLEQVVQSYDISEMAGGFYNRRGEVLATTSTTELKERFGVTSIALHRAELQAAMLEKADPEIVHLGQQLVRFEQHSGGVTAFFADGQQLEGSLLIGADGLHSVVRGQLFGFEKPRYAGYTAWRGVTTQPHQDLLPGELWGQGQRFGMVPLSQGRAYWFATKNGPEGGIDKAGERKPELLELFKDWHPAVRNVIEATPEEAILQNDIYDRKPSKSWSVGRITLLGDAAHPMTPNMGQGACQALEDAIVLADCLKNQTEDIPAALGRYQEQRLAHTSLVVTRSWRIGKIAQVANPVACWLRDTTLKLAPPSLQMKQLEPVVGHEI